MINHIVAEKIEKLTPTLSHKAQFLALASPEDDADDMFQEMVLQVIEHSEKDSNFCEQTDNYIIWDAVHTGGKGAARKSRTYGKYVDAEPQIAANDDDEDMGWVDSLADTSGNPEELFIESEEIDNLSAAISALSPDNQRIVTMLYQGYNQNEISEALGIGKSAVSQRKATIERQMAQYLA